jgi:hypothetical protein
MKRTLSLAILSLAALIAAGCSTPGPSRFEQWAFDVRTNYTPVVVVQTNEVLQIVTVYRTNEVAGVVTVTAATNLVRTLEPVTVTNWLAQVTYSPNTNAGTIASTGRVLGEPFGVGGLVGTLLGGIFSLWGIVRSSRARKAAAVLAQGIETGRAILRETPQGQQLDAEYRAWLEKDQKRKAVLDLILPLLERSLDTVAAETTAKTITKKLA